VLKYAILLSLCAFVLMWSLCCPRAHPVSEVAYGN
jgi:hypothetical protein